MKRTSDNRTAWRFDLEPGLVVVAVSGDDSEVVRARMDYDRTASTLRFHVVEYSHSLSDPSAAGRPTGTPPLDLIEQSANQPDNAVYLIDTRRPAIRSALTRKVLPYAKRPGKKPDAFYAAVLIYKRECEQAGEPYAQQIAQDNGVTPGVVYRWVAEAQRREITVDQTRDASWQARKAGEPIDLAPRVPGGLRTEPGGEPIADTDSEPVDESVRSGR
jgi:hypothetical protein